MGPARSHLRLVHGGFDSTDLKEAKALLQGLARRQRLFVDPNSTSISVALVARKIDVRSWHFSDIARHENEGRFQSESGHVRPLRTRPACEFAA